MLFCGDQSIVLCQLTHYAGSPMELIFRQAFAGFANG
jgi:hypothetical protein